MRCLDFQWGIVSQNFYVCAAFFKSVRECHALDPSVILPTHGIQKYCVLAQTYLRILQSHGIQKYCLYDTTQDSHVALDSNGRRDFKVYDRPFRPRHLRPVSMANHKL